MGLQMISLAILLAGLAISCSGGPQASASVTCRTGTDKSMDITRPTEFADVIASTNSDDPMVVFAQVDMLDSSGNVIGSSEDSLGMVSREPKGVTYPIGIPPGGVEQVSACSVTVIDRPGGANPQ
jgi:hypothetical protein